MIRIIGLLNNKWIAFNNWNDKIFETDNYREFRLFCRSEGLELPDRKDIKGMPCDGHYFQKGGWTKVIKRPEF